MELVPLGPGFGVEVKGVTMLDVASDADAYKAVRAAFEEHSLLVFRDQDIADDIQVAYSRAFGPLELTKVASLGAGGFYSRLTNLGEKGEIVPPDHRQVLVAKANALWHTDSSFKKTPALASVLTARVLPGEDGDTEFTSTRLAWERLPADLQAQAQGCGRHALLCQQPRPDPSRPRQCRGARRAAAGALADELAQPEQRPPRALRRQPRLCHRRHGRPRRPPAPRPAARRGDAARVRLRPQVAPGRRRDVGQPRHAASRPAVADYKKERSMIRTTISATDADGLDEVRPPLVH